MKAREIAFKILCDIEENNNYSNIAINKHFKNLKIWYTYIVNGELLMQMNDIILKKRKITYNKAIFLKIFYFV